MLASFSTKRRVEFRDTDAAGIVHFSVFFTYMEQAEHEFLRQLGMSVVMAENGAVVSWPRVSATCDYQAPVHFEEILDIQVTIDSIGSKSITYAFGFTRDGLPIADGKLVAVCCEVKRGEPPVSIAIPQPIRERLIKSSG